LIHAFLLAATLVAAATPSPAPSAAAPIVSPTASASATPAGTPTPYRTLPPNAHVWQGITPGGSAPAVHAKLGVPLLARVLPDGSIINWYPGPTTNAYMIVGERDKIVQYVRAFPISLEGALDGLKDPYGVSPGLDYTAIKALRGEAKEARQVAPATVVVVYQDSQGFVWLYELTAAGVHAISLYDANAPKANPAAPPVSDPHDGASMGRAYLVHARNEQEGLRFERYYATHRGGCSVWTVANQTVLSVGARKIDQLDLQCEDNKDQTSMFFDVTSFMGKN
jgi:hypothetical protein